MIVSDPIECDPVELERCPPIPDEAHTAASDTWASRAGLRDLYKVCALKHAGVVRCIDDHTNAGKRRDGGRR